MTEIERIIAKGVVPESFLKEEVRSEFVVDSKRKKIWAVQLDLLLEFDKVCKAHGLKYFLMFGTLLGAVRHKGFIPWDDDVDVGMLREDYEKLLKLGDEFAQPLFLQTPESDPGCFISYARLRNSNTTAVSRLFAYQKMNHGIFMDIFPLDNLTLEEGTERFDKIRELNIDNGTFMRMTNPNLDEKNLQRVAAYKSAGKNPQATYAEIQKVATSKNSLRTDYVSNLVCTISPLHQKTWKREDFEQCVMLPVEHLEFPAPKGYDRILSTSYGNYMELPPVEKRGVQHEHYDFDAEKPFSEYVK